MNDGAQVQIYVALLDEGTDVWRPVQAIPVSRDIYTIVSEHTDSAVERWQFQTGDVVRCEVKTFSGGSSGLVAVEKVNVPG